MTKIKICGITDLGDAQAAIRFGADQIGLNFYRRSPRFVTVEKARRITGAVDSSTEFVGVFVNESIKRIVGIVKLASLDVVQLHGDETRQFIRDLRDETGMAVIKAIRVASNFAPAEQDSLGADAILLDSFSANHRGGTGKTFDWTSAQRFVDHVPRLYLAGGLTPDNVREAIAAVRPYAVDTCSGVESRPGKKDLNKLKLFVERAREND